MKPDHLVFLLLAISLTASALLAYFLVIDDSPETAAAPARASAVARA